MPEVDAQMRLLGLDADDLTAVEWEALLADSGLPDRVVRVHRLETRREIRDRIAWVGARWARGFGRDAGLYLREPAARGMLRQYVTAPSIQLMSKLGYGLFVGRKEGPSAASTTR